MDLTKSIREVLPHPADMTIDADIGLQDSYELRDLAETIANRHPGFAWMIVDVWLSKQNQHLIDK